MKNRQLKIALLTVFILCFTLPEQSSAQLLGRRKKKAAQEAEAAARKEADDKPVPVYVPVKTEPLRSEISDEVWMTLGNINLGKTPEGYDSLLSHWYSRNVVDSHDSYFKQYIDIDSLPMPADDTPDSVYIARLKNLVSPIHLGFNDVVKTRILAYTRWKGTMSRMIGLSQLYFPMIEETLSSYGLPIELRMLPVIESALNPTAVSKAGATGLWQFMYITGKSYGLEIGSLVDERLDPVKATDAACRFLRDLYGMYGNWTLAIAAYNCGPGNVNKALRRAGDNARNFWDVYEYLPRETRGYVPAFIAATYAYAYHRQHGIEPTPPPLPIARDTIHINRLMHFEQISSVMGTPVELLRELNPQYKADIIPAVGKSYALMLPQRDVSRYLAHENDIHAKDSVYLASYLNKDLRSVVAQSSSSPTGTTVYRVKSGDTLSAIAKKHGVTVSQLMKWNNLKNANTLRVGQRLQVYK